MLVIHKIHYIKSFIILVISDTKIALFDALMCIFSVSSTEANSVHFSVNYVSTYFFSIGTFF